MEYYQEVISYFNISDMRTDEHLVLCPYHDDTRPSASINIKKGLFNCFVCGGKNFNQLYNEVINESIHTNGNNSSIVYGMDRINLDQYKNTETIMSNPTDFKIGLANLLTSQLGNNFRILRDISDKEMIHHLRELIISKGIQTETLTKIGAYPITDKNTDFYGYIYFPNNLNGKGVYRKFLPDDVVNGERYINSSGEKPYYGDINNDAKDYILVEGIFDYISLLESGFNNVICNLGTAINDKRAYKFRGKVVFILFDNDYAGFTGAEKAYQTLKKIKAHPIILELPEKFGKDVNEAIKNCKEDFLIWLHKLTRKFDTDDSNYIDTFGEEENLYTLKTHLNSFNNLFGGGLKVGLHVIAAEPSVGKSALTLDFSSEMVYLNKDCKGLFNTYEISKRQCWARLASKKDSRAWSLIETDTILEPASKEYCKELGKRLRIEAYWGISEIMRVANDYNFFVIDYLQKMPGDSDERINTVRNLKALSKLATQQEKVILIVSTLSRGGYGKEELSIFKESGDIEYSVQSACLLSTANAGGGIQRMIKVTVLKNTRGPVGGNFWIQGNMLHNKFEDTVGLKIESGDF